MPDDSHKIFAARVQSERISRGMSQRQLAEQTGMSQNTINRIENGSENIGMDKAETLSKFFNCTVYDMMTPNRYSSLPKDEVHTEAGKARFSKNLKVIAARKGLTPVMIAKKTDLNLDTVRSYFAGARVPSSTSLHKLTKALEADPADFFRDEIEHELPKTEPAISPEVIQRLENRLRDIDERLKLLDERNLKGFAVLESILKRRV